MKHFLALVWVLLSSGFSVAAALMHIQGTLVSFTHEHYLISRNHTVYYIKRDALSDVQRQSLQKTGDTVEVVVPPAAIELVKTDK